ncbi:MAG: tryptophan--tRNA ligase [Candidatus Acidiferrales bacterium]
MNPAENALAGEFSQRTRAKGKRKRVLSGMRPTGRLHLGHYFGALSNWLKLQEEYDCFYFVADWHALTTHYEETSSIAQNTLEVVTDWLSVGLDPEKSTMFVQSQILEHAELHLLLSMVTPLSWLERVPTYKEQIENLRDRNLGTYGFLGYPLLQTADIVMYGVPKTELLVPVGEDQAPHIELSREIVRRFNAYFGLRVDRDKLSAPRNLEAATALCTQLSLQPGQQFTWESAPSAVDVAQRIRRHAAEIGFKNFVESYPKCRPFIRQESILREPEVMLTETPRLPGTDGRRMAKSYGNAIWLSDPPDEIRGKVHNMMTDPQRVRRTDPGRPEVCPVFAYHKLFSTPDVIAWSDHGCRTAEIGCVDCKAKMAEGLIRWIEPIQARRKELEAQPQQVWDILDAGSAQARKTARRTMRRVREAIFDWDAVRKAASVAGPSIRKVATGD